MIKLYCKENNHVTVLDEKDSIIDIHQDDDGIIIIIHTSLKTVMAWLDKATKDIRKIYDNLSAGDWFSVDGVSIYDPELEDLDDEDDYEEDDEDEDDEDGDR